MASILKYNEFLYFDLIHCSNGYLYTSSCHLQIEMILLFLTWITFQVLFLVVQWEHFIPLSINARHQECKLHEGRNFM
jgi:hypothetical protein